MTWNWSTIERFIPFSQSLILQFIPKRKKNEIQKKMKHALGKEKNIMKGK
jgi:hypothetical protein